MEVGLAVSLIESAPYGALLGWLAHDFLFCCLIDCAVPAHCATYSMYSRLQGELDQRGLGLALQRWLRLAAPSGDMYCMLGPVLALGFSAKWAPINVGRMAYGRSRMHAAGDRESRGCALSVKPNK